MKLTKEEDLFLIMMHKHEDGYGHVYCGDKECGIVYSLVHKGFGTLELAYKYPLNPYDIPPFCFKINKTKYEEYMKKEYPNWITKAIHYNADTKMFDAYDETEANVLITCDTWGKCAEYLEPYAKILEEATTYYKPLKVKELSTNGFYESMLAMRLPKKSESDSEVEDGLFFLGKSDKRLAGNLIRAGNDHAKAMRGIIVWMNIECQVGWLIEFETYRHGVECLSTSSAMHGELVKLKGKELAEQKQKDLSAKVYTRILHCSYQALRSMYKARRNHRHPDWGTFCNFIEELPYFDSLIMPKKND